MSLAAYPDRAIRYRVVRTWPGSPPAGAEISSTHARLPLLLKQGAVEPVKKKGRGSAGRN